MATISRERIERMPAGREMDALVAKYVMGWRPHFRNSAFYVPEAEECSLMGRPKAAIGEWCPSTNIAAAMEVVERLSMTHHWRLCTPFMPGAKFFAGLTEHGIAGWNGTPDNYAPGDSLPHAICRAAILSRLS